MAMALNAVIAVSLVTAAVAECPSACSAHGTCGAFDMCTCYRKWTGNDCSQRICQFGFAHVDIPLGDLDSSSGPLTMTDLTPGVNFVPYTAIKSDMYPQGVSELFPNMVDSNQNILDNTAHWYSECSSKGICDRETGLCECFEGFVGSSCQRTECPITNGKICSDHGKCLSKKTLANNDYNHVYYLWDEHIFHGCECDSGYYGADCSKKYCKFGVDPNYEESIQTARFSNWTFAITTDADKGAVTVTGNYSIIYHDTKGVKWMTKQLDISSGCPEIIDALETIPNDVIPLNSVRCLKWTADTVEGSTTVYEPVDTSHRLMHSKFTLAFPDRPGEQKMMDLYTTIDANRNTLYTDEPHNSTLDWYVFNNGFYGENDDWMPDLCEGVKVNFGRTWSNDPTVTVTDTATNLYTLTVNDPEQLRLFKICLGDANGDPTDNVEVENWDYGDMTTPHIVKLIDDTQDLLVSVDPDVTHFHTEHKSSTTYICNQTAPLNADGMCEYKDPAGFYVVMYWDNVNQYFVMFGRAGQDYPITQQFHVYTTKGVLRTMDTDVQLFNTWNDKLDGTASSQKDLLTNKIYTKARLGTTREAMDCETTSSYTDCIKRGDLLMLFNTGFSYHSQTQLLTNAQRAVNPLYPMIYRVEKAAREIIPQDIWQQSEPVYNDWSTASKIPEFVQNQILLDKSVNARFHLDTITEALDTSGTFYRFTPPANAYRFATQCSARGICNTVTGDCECFNGFWGDNCRNIDVLANSFGKEDITV